MVTFFSSERCQAERERPSCNCPMAMEKMPLSTWTTNSAGSPAVLQAQDAAPFHVKTPPSHPLPNSKFYGLVEKHHSGTAHIHVHLHTKLCLNSFSRKNLKGPLIARRVLLEGSEDWSSKAAASLWTGEERGLRKLPGVESGRKISFFICKLFKERFSSPFLVYSWY